MRRSRGRCGLRGACTLSLLLLAACSRPSLVSLNQGVRRYTRGDYDSVLARWTRSGQRLSFPEMENHLGVAATYLSWDFRWAYVARLAHDARMSDVDRTRTLDASLETSRHEHEFYVTLYTDSPRWGELGRPDSAWRVTLVDDRGCYVAPFRIERYRRISAADQEYFPYTTPWRQAFRLHFPRQLSASGDNYEVLGPGTRYFILRFGGPFGAVDLRWDVHPHG